MNASTLTAPAHGGASSASVGSAPSVVNADELWQRAFERAPQKGLVISSAAASFGAQKLEKRGTPRAAIRLGIKGGGCSGFSYVIQFEDGAPKERDYAFEVDGVRFVVDKKSFVYLAGSVFDYEKTLMFQGFKFRNPQEASSCGCGHSFTVK